jgi:hypothetical protein
VKQKEKEDQHESQSLEIHNLSPQIVPQDLKKKVIAMFDEETSSKTLLMFTCAVCDKLTLNSTQCKVSIDTVDLEILKDIKSCDKNILQLPLPINDGPLKGVMLDLEGVVINSEKNTDIQLLLCKSCSSSVKKKNTCTLLC